MKIVSALLAFLLLVSSAIGSEKVDRMLSPFVSVERASGAVIKSWKDDRGHCWCYVLTCNHVASKAYDERKATKGFPYSWGQFLEFDHKGQISGTKDYFGRLEEFSDRLDYAIVSFKTEKIRPACRVMDRRQFNLFDKVFVVGRPNGEDIWVGKGMICSLDVKGMKKSPNVKRIGHDAGVYYGNSGGPLFDASYSLIGINTHISVDHLHLPVEHLGYSVPLDAVYADLGPQKTFKYFSVLPESYVKANKWTKSSQKLSQR